jgi:hypothetical protein
LEVLTLKEKNIRQDLKVETLLRKIGQIKDVVEWTCHAWATSRIPWTVSKIKMLNNQPLAEEIDE